MRRPWLFVVVGLLLVLVVAGLTLFRGGGGRRGGKQSAAPRGGGGAGAARERGVDDGPLAWAGEAGFPEREIAGRVTLDGQPYPGATVRLESAATDAGAIPAPEMITAADGAFAFGRRRAGRFVLVAEAPGMTGDRAFLDLRDPAGKPAPERVELRLERCAASLFGTVQDASGGVVSLARVAAASGPAVLSDDEGRYELCVPMGRASLLASADGYGTVAVDRAVYGRDRLDLSLLPEVVIVGRVVQAGDGSPVADALVSVMATSWEDRDGATRTGVSAADGGFRIAGVSAGRRRISAVADGFASAEPLEVRLEAGQTREGIELALHETHSISGRVVYMKETTKPPGGAKPAYGGAAPGQPVAGVEVTAANAGSRFGGANAITTAGGTFTLRGLLPGQVTLDVTDHLPVGSQRLTLEERDLEDVIIEVLPAGSISGRVLAGGKPVEDADVWAELEGGRRSAMTRSGDGGAYELRGLLPGRHLLTAESLQAGAYARDVPVTLAPVEHKTGVDIEMDLAGSISGVVVEENGAPVPAVHVRFTLIEGRDFGFATTAADGSFVARALSGGGTYAVEVKPTARSEQSLPPAAGGLFPDVYVKDGRSQVTGVRLVVKVGKLSIAGRVVTAGGKPAADVKVRAAPSEGERVYFPTWAELVTTTTDTDGAFTLTGLLPGEYGVQATAPTGARVTKSGIESGRSDVVLQLPETGSIAGTLVGFPHRPTVAALSLGGGEHGRFQATVQGASFMIDGLAPGPYVVSAVGLDGAASTSVTIEAGKAAPVTLASAGAGTLSGTVTELRTGAPVTDGSCHFLPTLGGDDRRAQEQSYAVGAGQEADIDGSGRFSFTSVPAGPGLLRCYGSTMSGMFHDSVRLTIPAGQAASVTLRVFATRPDQPDQEQVDIGMSFDFQTSDPVVAWVQPEGPAGRGGLLQGDRVVSVDGTDVAGATPYAVMYLMIYRSPADAIDLVVERGGARVPLSFAGVPVED